ncbi:MAG: undecaprenyl-diphosphate phosphatase, partial [Methanobrevibacter sp.]|nr:undecaprenyl-diphosphate phosphatase [Methanobrevibacter sp.]
VTGTILYLSQRMASGQIDMSHMGWFQSLFMGLGQACAIMPGLSRSGTTIATGLVVGLDKEFAAKFSFILSIPAIFGAFIIQLKDIGLSMGTDGAAVMLGFIAAFISGYLAIKWLLDLIQNKSLDIFAYYCWIVGIVVFMGSIAHIF